jgi:hypothetical protein
VSPVHIRLDLSILRQGVTVGWQFGFGALAQLVRVGEFLEHCVYERGSLRHTRDGVAFTFRNPPLRMGAFSGIRVYWDGTLLPASSVRVLREGDDVGSTLDQVDPAHPIAFAFGRRIHFQVSMPSPPAGVHTARLEFQSVAIPPLVWFELKEPVGDEVAR